VVAAVIIIKVVLLLRRNSRSRTAMTLNKAQSWLTTMGLISLQITLMCPWLAVFPQMRGHKLV
jgi:hypothetical protein